MPRDARGNVIPGSYGPTGPGGTQAPTGRGPTGQEVGDLTTMLKGMAKGGSPGFASSRRTAAPMKSVGTPVVGGGRNRRGRDTQFRGAETRVSRPRGGGKGGPVRRRGQRPSIGGASAAGRGPATAGPPMGTNDPNSFRPPRPMGGPGGPPGLGPQGPQGTPPGQPMGASVAGAASPIARAAMGGAPAMPGVRRPQRPGGMLGAAQNRRV